MNERAGPGDDGAYDNLFSCPKKKLCIQELKMECPVQIATACRNEEYSRAGKGVRISLNGHGGCGYLCECNSLVMMLFCHQRWVYVCAERD